MWTTVIQLFGNVPNKRATSRNSQRNTSAVGYCCPFMAVFVQRLGYGGLTDFKEKEQSGWVQDKHSLSESGSQRRSHLKHESLLGRELKT